MAGRRDTNLDDDKTQGLLEPENQVVVHHNGEESDGSDHNDDDPDDGDPDDSDPDDSGSGDSGMTVHSAGLSRPAWSVSDIKCPGSNVSQISGQNDDKHFLLLRLTRSRVENEYSDSGIHALPNQATETWLASQVEPKPIAAFMHDGTRKAKTDLCDIDTYTGNILKPVKQPATYTHPEAKLDENIRGISWRQMNLTSENRIENERKKQRHSRQVAKLQSQQIEQFEFEEDPWPNAHCLLRPATVDDFEGICQIINAEMKQEHPQVLESSPFNPQKIHDIFRYCQNQLRPFIVAVASANAFMDRSKWPKGADKEFEEFVKYKKLQQPSANPGTVLGFAFVSDSRPGMFGSGCYGSRFTGRITVLVHPDHRRKLYGTALLDRVLLSVAIYHRSVVDYKWECSDTALIYEHPVTRNQRQYARLHIEALVPNNDDQKEEWVNAMLEKFEFSRAGRLTQTARTGSGGDGVWLDAVMWQLEARPVTEITEQEPQRRVPLLRGD